MKARELINGASFRPETIEAMGQAFEDAWARIARMFRGIEIQAARARLAEAMLSVATEGCTDIVALRADALDAMAKEYRSSVRPRSTPDAVAGSIEECRAESARPCINRSRRGHDEQEDERRLAYLRV